MKASLAQILLSSDQGPLAMALRVALAPIQVIYMLVVNARNALYDAGLIASHDAGVPVISVGNVTVGGTGKTPLVIALARRGVAAGKKVAVVTRGYGSIADDQGRTDEVKLIADRVPEAEVIVCPDKLTGARQAAEKGCDVVIVDDGMQHRRLNRDLDICVVDARAPFGNGFQLPLGGLRESPTALGRSDLVVMTHCEHMDPDDVIDSRTRVQAQKLGLQIIQAEHHPIGVRSVTAEPGDLDPVEHLAGETVFLFCGIGSPEGFVSTVEALGAEVAGVMSFPDHHAYTGADLQAVRAAAQTARLVCTEKDASKIAAIKGSDDVLCLAIAMELVGDLPQLPGIDG